MKEARQEGTNPEEFHSYEVPRGTKSIGRDSRVVGTGGGDGGRVCRGTECRFGRMEGLEMPAMKLDNMCVC